MDIQKNHLTCTFDSECELIDHFIINGVQTELSVYQDHIIFNYNAPQNTKVYFNDQTVFEIVYLQKKCQGIRFFTPMEYFFANQNWTDFKKWEDVLINKIKQKNFHQYFRPIRKVGKGNFATVYLAHNIRPDTLVAIKAFVKEIAFKNNGKRALNNEIKILRKLSSLNIMKIYGVYETDNSLYIATEYIQGMTLQNYLKTNKGKISLQKRRNIIRMILKALNQMEAKGILHRDLKPQNIMISSDGKNLKLVDFGLATQTKLQKYIFVRCGTPGYVAPQILRIRDDQKPILCSISDIFSLGSIFYQIIFQRRLFDAFQHEDVLNLNRACIINFTQQMKSSICFDEADLLQKMLITNPNKRISASQALQHAYIIQKNVNIFGSVRNRISKPVYLKNSRKNITSLQKGQIIKKMIRMGCQL